MTPAHRGNVDTAALLVVRVWRDAGQFRARLTSVADVEHGVPLEMTTASPDELERCVEAWLFDVRHP
ncbi:MAG TPA: hypothetical protein VFJ14_14130 [Nocardioidaceae bacterium]|nr:hypothetical protein [Nocardioidaceae bacterium]